MLLKKNEHHNPFTGTLNGFLKQEMFDVQEANMEAYMILNTVSLVSLCYPLLSTPSQPSSFSLVQSHGTPLWSRTILMFEPQSTSLGVLFARNILCPYPQGHTVLCSVVFWLNTVHPFVISFFPSQRSLLYHAIYPLFDSDVSKAQILLRFPLL